MVKQIVRVLDAIAQGANTNPDIQAVTGLSSSAVGTYLQRLRSDGLIRDTGRVMRTGLDGRPAHVYEPIGDLFPPES